MGEHACTLPLYAGMYIFAVAHFAQSQIQNDIFGAQQF